MNNLKKHRVRAPNFTQTESQHLCDVLEKYKDIIENKKTDGASLQDKQKAWLKVVEEYNSTTNMYSRTLESLQQNYKNMKKKVKKQLSSAKMSIPVDREILIESIEEHGYDDWQKISDSVGASQDECQVVFDTMKKEAKKKDSDTKKDIMGTGGGPSKHPRDNPLLEKVCSLVGPTLDGMYTIYDGDSTLMASQGLDPVEAKNETTLRSTPSPVTFTNNRSNLKRKMNPRLASTNKKKYTGNETVCDKFKSLAGEKMELVKVQKELMSKQLELEEEKLAHIRLENELVNLQIKDQEEKVVHSRMLRSIEMEEVKKKIEHNESLRKIELEKANKSIFN